MWPFPGTPDYMPAASGSGSGSASAAPVPCPTVLGRIFGSTPSYVPATGTTPSAGPFAPLAIEIFNPPIAATERIAQGPALAITPPLGASRYAVYFSPASPVGSGTAFDAAPLDTVEPSNGAIGASGITITPVWVRLNPYDVADKTVKAKLLITFA